MARITRFDGRLRTRRARIAPHNAVWLLILLAAVGLMYFPADGGPILKLPKIGNSTEADASFGFCGTLRRSNCVIDGDTFKLGGESIRIADIDAPETHPSRCDHEAEMGEAATLRLRELLSEGPFQLRTQGRDEDRYGRKLRIVTRDGHSIGAMLVNEGLAREWTGRRRPWCDRAAG